MLNRIKNFFAGKSTSSATGEAADSQLVLASKYKEQGDAHLQNGNLVAATADYRNAIECNPRFAYAFCRLGYAFKEQQLFHEAQAALVEAINIDPALAETHYLLGTVMLACGNADAANTHFRTAIALDSDFEHAYLDLCMMLFQREDFDETIRIAHAGLAHIPNAVNLLLFLGNSYHASKQFDLAITAFETALSIRADRSDILSNLSLSLLAGGYAERAIPVLRKVVALDPASIVFQNNLGSALHATKNFDDAFTCFKKVLELDPTDLIALSNTGRALQGAGKYEEAIIQYEETLEIAPNHIEARQNLGDIFRSLGKYEDAIKHYRFGLELQPNSADLHIRMGFAFQATNDLNSALDSYEKAILANSEFIDAHHNAANILALLGRDEEAITRYQHALHLNPEFVEAHLNLGASLQNLGKFDEAISCYLKVIEINPQFTAAHQNLGIVLLKLGRTEDAMNSYRQVLKLDPTRVEIRLYVGISLENDRKIDAAIAVFRENLQFSPNHVATLNHLGGILYELGRSEEAEPLFRQILQIEPENEGGHYGLANVLTKMHRFDDAIASFREAIRIKPTFTGAHGNLANVLSDVGRFEESMATYQAALQSGPTDFKIYSNLLFVRNYMPDLDSVTLREEAAHFGELVTLQAHPYTDWANAPKPDRRLRIGLVSGDFRLHPVGFFVANTVAALASNMDSGLELIAYSNCSYSDYWTEQIREHCYAWRMIADLSDETVAKQIRSDDIDILLDLSGHSSMNRLPLMAWKPAPIQASWLGYFATTGVNAIDYFIADPWSVPAGNESQFTEKIWQLPETRFSFTPPETDIPVSALPALQNGYLTFGCFNNLAKMTDHVVALWTRIMQAVPESRLFLKSLQLGDEKVRRDIITRFGKQGISEDRLIMEGFTSRADYLAAYHRVDIALDPFPYTGGATTAESLWMGVPVFTLTGERLIARQGTGLLMNAGLPDWVAASEEDYLASVVRHASDLQRLAALRAGLREQVLASPLFDAHRLARHLETALRQMWGIWCEQQEKHLP